jgi:pimeloyl-ACP methyl ester carboxylesterase
MFVTIRAMSSRATLSPHSKVLRSDPHLVLVNGVDLCVQTFGEPDDPAILLIAGAECSMDWWEDDFCELLASGRRFVVRYDLRDTGQSVSYEPGAPGYDGSDLVADAVELLDALGIDGAHVVGMSMGGGIAQHLGIEHADRVATLTLISTTPIGKSDLPPMSRELSSHLAEPVPEPDWTDRDAVIDHIVEGLRPFSGSLSFDENRQRALVERVVDRTANIASSMTNHWVIDGGDPVRGSLSDVTAPTLVLHGTEDPLFPFGNAEALADEIPGARLVPLEGSGHEMPPRPLWDQVVGAILEHTSVTA